MNKKELSRILEFGSREEIKKLADMVAENHTAVITKEPEKTMVMIQAKEPNSQTGFYLGEMLAAQCYVEIDGAKGLSVMAGDDLEKVKFAAIVDGAHTAKINEWNAIEQELMKIEKCRQTKIRKEAALYRDTQVNFRVMEDRDEKEISI